jgi:hypothetical protein
VSHFLTDQLEVEMKREQLVKEGKLTEKEADQLNEEWEQVSNFFRQHAPFRSDGRSTNRTVAEI